MNPFDVHLLPAEFVAGVMWTAICFVLGVSWSAYRAVGWVDRMRAWAGSVCDSLAETAGEGRGPEGVPHAGGLALAVDHGSDYFDSAYRSHDGRGWE